MWVWACSRSARTSPFYPIANTMLFTIVEAVLPLWKLHCHHGSCITIMEAALPIEERAGAGYQTCIAVIEAVSLLWKLYHHHGSCIAHQGEGRGGLSNIYCHCGSCIIVVEVVSLSLFVMPALSIHFPHCHHCVAPVPPGRHFPHLCIVPPHHSCWSHTSCPSSYGASFSSSQSCIFFSSSSGASPPLPSGPSFTVLTFT